MATAGAVILASKLSKIETVKLDPEELCVGRGERARDRLFERRIVGVDSREGDMEENTRSDTIMIASLNRETLEVKISSVYRDTMLEQKDGTLNKANAAYAFGGPEDAIAMLNRNLDMDIEHYVTVNFDALIDVIDAVGGVEIDVQEEEISYICGYAMEIMDVTGRVSPGVTEPGLQTLNGVQATAYSRIRYTAGDDFKRAERQRDVLTKIVGKLQNASLSQINKIIDKVFPEVSTNFTLAEILEYAKDAFDYQLGETEGFPFDKSTDTLSNIGSVVIPVTLEDNVKKLHEFFYGDTEGYTPSSTVTSISSRLCRKPETREADLARKAGRYAAATGQRGTGGTGNSGGGQTGNTTTGNNGGNTGGTTGGTGGNTGGTGGGPSGPGGNTGRSGGTGGDQEAPAECGRRWW